MYGRTLNTTYFATFDEAGRAGRLVFDVERNWLRGGLDGRLGTGEAADDIGKELQRTVGPDQAEESLVDRFVTRRR